MANHRLNRLYNKYVDGARSLELEVVSYRKWVKDMRFYYEIKPNGRYKKIQID